MRARKIRSIKTRAIMVARARQRAAKLAAAPVRARAIAAVDRHHRAVHGRLSCRVVRAVLSRAEIHRKIPGPGRGADRTADVWVVRISVRAAAVEQPHHRLHEFVPQSGDGVSPDAAGSGPDHFRWKLIESTVLASWAFVFSIAPLLAAFGLLRGVP